MRIHDLSRFLIYPCLVLAPGILIAAAVEAGAGLTLVLLTTCLVALAVVVLERVLPYETQWNQDRGDRMADAVHFLVNALLKQASVVLYAWIVARMTPAVEVWPAGWPFLVQVVLALVIVDVFLYAVHRLSHSNALLWRLHSIHHGSRRLYWINGEKRHPVHQILEGFPGVAVLYAAGAPARPITAALSILGLHMMLQHANINYHTGILRYIFSVAEIHRFHHVRDTKRGQVNFGAFLAIWDLMFATYSWRNERVGAEDVGLDRGQKAPQSYVDQFLHPFRRSGQPAPAFASALTDDVSAQE